MPRCPAYFSLNLLGETRKPLKHLKWAEAERNLGSDPANKANCTQKVVNWGHTDSRKPETITDPDRTTPNQTKVSAGARFSSTRRADQSTSTLPRTDSQTTIRAKLRYQRTSGLEEEAERDHVTSLHRHVEEQHSHRAKTAVAAGWKRSPVGSYFPKLTMAAHLIWGNICLNTKAADCTVFDGLKAKFADSRLNNYWVVIETCFSLPFVHILSEHFYTGWTEMSERYLCSRRVRRLKPQNEQEPKTVEHQRCERCQTEAASNVSAKKHFQSIISKRVEYQRQIPLAVIPNSILKFIGSNSKREKASNVCCRSASGLLLSSSGNRASVRDYLLRRILTCVTSDYYQHLNFKQWHRVSEIEFTYRL